MRVVRGLDVKVSVDESGGMISVDWHCPYCGEYNAGFYYSSKSDILSGDFEIDHECEECGKMVTIECIGVQELFS